MATILRKNSIFWSFKCDNSVNGCKISDSHLLDKIDSNLHNTTIFETDSGLVRVSVNGEIYEVNGLCTITEAMGKNSYFAGKEKTPMGVNLIPKRIDQWR